MKLFSRIRKGKDIAVMDGKEIHVGDEEKEKMLKRSIVISIPDTALDAGVMVIAGIGFFIVHKTHRWWAIPTSAIGSDALFNGAHVIRSIIHLFTK